MKTNKQILTEALKELNEMGMIGTETGPMSYPGTSAPDLAMDIDLAKTDIMTHINAEFAWATEPLYINVYTALKRVQMVAAKYCLVPFQSQWPSFLSTEGGQSVIRITQFGPVSGVDTSGNFQMQADPVEQKLGYPLYLVFEWEMNEDGRYEVFAGIMREDEVGAADEEAADEAELLEPAEVEVSEGTKDYHNAAAKALATFYKADSARLANQGNKKDTKQAEKQRDYHNRKLNRK